MFYRAIHRDINIYVSQILIGHIFIGPAECCAEQMCARFRIVPAEC